MFRALKLSQSQPLPSRVASKCSNQPGGIVDTQVHLQSADVVVELQYWNFGIDQLDIAPDEVPAFLPEQFSDHGEPLFARDSRALRVETHVQVCPGATEPIEGGARDSQATLEVLVEAAVELAPQLDLPVQQPPLLPSVVEEPQQVEGQPVPPSASRGLRVHRRE